MDENLRFTYQRNLKHRVLRVLKTFLFLDYVLKSNTVCKLVAHSYFLILE